MLSGDGWPTRLRFMAGTRHRRSGSAKCSMNVGVVAVLVVDGRPAERARRGKLKVDRKIGIDREIVLRAH